MNAYPIGKMETLPIERSSHEDDSQININYLKSDNVLCKSLILPSVLENSTSSLTTSETLPFPQEGISLSDVETFLQLCGGKEMFRNMTMLLAVQSLMTARRMALFSHFGITLYLVTPNPKFKCGITGKDVSINGEISWFYWDGTTVPDRLEVYYLCNDKTDNNVMLNQKKIECMQN
jgi:hypothetical protein